jgi:hypothetical protein
MLEIILFIGFYVYIDVPKDPKYLPNKPDRQEPVVDKNTSNKYILEEIGFEPMVQLISIQRFSRSSLETIQPHFQYIDINT